MNLQITESQIVLDHILIHSKIRVSNLISKMELQRGTSPFSLSSVLHSANHTTALPEASADVSIHTNFQSPYHTHTHTNTHTHTHTKKDHNKQQDNARLRRSHSHTHTHTHTKNITYRQHNTLSHAHCTQNIQHPSTHTLQTLAYCKITLFSTFLSLTLVLRCCVLCLI